MTKKLNKSDERLLKKLIELGGLEKQIAISNVDLSELVFTRNLLDQRQKLLDLGYIAFEASTSPKRPSVYKVLKNI